MTVSNFPTMHNSRITESAMSRNGSALAADPAEVGRKRPRTVDFDRDSTPEPELEEETSSRPMSLAQRDSITRSPTRAAVGKADAFRSISPMSLFEPPSAMLAPHEAAALQAPVCQPKGRRRLTSIFEANRIVSPQKNTQYVYLPSDITRTRVMRRAGPRLPVDAAAEFGPRIFETDDLGRPSRVTGPVRLTHLHLRADDDYRRGALIGKPTDVAFHLAANGFGFPGGPLNVVPGDVNLNIRDYAQYEGHIAEAARKERLRPVPPGAEQRTVAGEFRAIYLPDNATRRPDLFHVRYWCAPASRPFDAIGAPLGSKVFRNAEPPERPALRVARA